MSNLGVVKVSFGSKLVVRYDTHGGYDCMSSAYIIEVEGKDQVLFAIDTDHFDEDDSTRYKHTEHPEAKLFAETLIARWNAGAEKWWTQ